MSGQRPLQHQRFCLRSRDRAPPRGPEGPLTSSSVPKGLAVGRPPDRRHGSLLTPKLCSDLGPGRSEARYSWSNAGVDVTFVRAGTGTLSIERLECGEPLPSASGLHVLEGTVLRRVGNAAWVLRGVGVVSEEVLRPASPYVFAKPLPV